MSFRLEKTVRLILSTHLFDGFEKNFISEENIFADAGMVRQHFFNFVKLFS